MSALRAGAELGWARLRTPSLALLLGAGALLSVALVRLLRERAPFSALDDLLEGPILGWGLPLAAYWIAQRVTDDRRLDDSVQPLALKGQDRRLLAIGLLLVAAGLSALTGGLLTAVAVSTAHGALDGAWLRDLASSTIVALGGGAAYAAWFWAASALGRRGGGRRWALVLDFFLGAGSSSLALPFPRSHLRNLLGGVPPAELSQRSGWLAFVLLSALVVFFALRRVPS